MRLQYVSSACVVVEHEGVRVLCDPWIVDGAYGGSWYHTPPLSATPEDFHDCQFCYVSHIHPDHACLATIDRLSRKTVMLIGNYAEKFLGNRLRAMGFDVRELPQDDFYVLGGGLSMQIVPADGCNPELCGKWIGCEIKNPQDQASYQIDSFAVFFDGTHTIWNVNDCPYELAKHAIERARFTYPPPDLLCVGYAGAGPWPQCFAHLSRAQKQIEAEQKKAQFIHQMKQFVAHLRPKAFLPFAGQYTLGGSLVDLNDLRGVPELDELPDDPRMVRLNRMAWFDCETGQASEPFVPQDRAARLAYRETLRSKRLDHEADEWPTCEELGDLMEQAQAALQRRCAARGFAAKTRVYLDWHGQRCSGLWEVWFNEKQPVTDSITYVELDARLLKRLLTRKAHWNNCEIGSLLTYEREGNYDRGAMHHLSYLHI